MSVAEARAAGEYGAVDMVETELVGDQLRLIIEVDLGFLLNLAKTYDIGLLCTDQISYAVQTIDRVHT